MKVPSTDAMVDQARRAEAAGWTGVTYTDSQNLCPDPYVGIALAARATEQLRFATGVTNAHTRHPAALATTAATVGEVSGGRFVLGIGRGDTALFHLGLPPMPVAPFVERVTALQTYLAGESVDADGHASRIQWLARATAPKVPLDIACSGPRVIAFAASLAEHVTFALGADPDRLAWGLDHARKAAAEAGRDPATISFGAYVNIGCHPDLDAARAMIASSVSAFAHFSAMPGSTGAGLRGPNANDGLTDEDRAVVADVGRRYDSRQHLRPGAAHNDALDAGFIDRFAITGPPEQVIDRINQLAALGIERLIVTGPGFGTPRDHARTANQLLTGQVLPAVTAR
jgi:5,10-methylenetetrahydromethanopterin reductase